MNFLPEVGPQPVLEARVIVHQMFEFVDVDGSAADTLSVSEKCKRVAILLSKRGFRADVP